jgi:hypothetical protein
MRQKHNTQLANFDVASFRVTASDRMQEAGTAVHFRSRYAAEIPRPKYRFELYAFASRASVTIGRAKTNQLDLDCSSPPISFFGRCKTISFQKNVDEKTKEAFARGEFDNLPGKGKPLDAYFATPQHLRMGYSILKSADIIPESFEVPEKRMVCGNVSPNKRPASNSNPTQKAFRTIINPQLLPEER